MPDSFATTDNGLLLIANGWEPMLHWDGLTPQPESAGVLPPTTACSLNGSGTGAIVGTYYAFVRFVDGYGNYSNLSPISASASLPAPDPADAGTGTFTKLQLNGFVNIVKGINSGYLARNLTWTSGYILDGQVHLQNQSGGSGVSWQLVFTDTKNYTIYKRSAGTVVGVFSATTNTTVNPANTLAGVATITYENVPVPVEPKVARRQILRNTAGQTQTFYVDVDTTDLTSTTFTSTKDDPTLSAQSSFSLFDDQNRSLVDLFHLPPCHKSVLVAHLDRMYAAVDIEYIEGCVSVTFGSKTVTGIGTEWSLYLGGVRGYVNRFLYVVGAPVAYEIVLVDPVNQILTLDKVYQGPTDPFASYAIRPAPGEKQLIYYTEAGNAESWPSTNAFAILEDGDDPTGLMSKGSLLYILKRKHIYRWTVGSDPAADGAVFLSANRGCVNNRCWALVENDVYMMDEGGVWSFSVGSSGGQQADSLSESIQDLFETYPSPDGGNRINWSAQKTFHAIHNPAETTVRWFVALSGQYLPSHSLTYCYRSNRWSVDKFPFPIGSSVLGRFRDEPQVYLGGPAGKVYAYGKGYLDGPDAASGTVQGTATSATPTSISDSAASFPALGLVGNPIAIIGGRGKGQLRRITSVVGPRLNINQPWLIQPDTTSVYQLGAIPFTFRSGWFRWKDDESEHPRSLEIVYKPVEHSATFDARLYIDLAQTPVLWGTTYTSEQQNGFSSTDGSADLIADMTKPSGFVQRRLNDQREFYVDGPRFVQVEIGGIGGQDGVAIYQITLDGAIQ